MSSPISGPGVSVPERVVVVIASAHRSAILSEVLQAWAEIEDPVQSLIVCVPDSASEPSGVSDPRMLVVRGPRGLTAQRNAAIAMIPDDVAYVAFFDDDCIPHAAYLSRAISHLAADPRVVGLTGRVLLDGARRQAVELDTARNVLAEFLVGNGTVSEAASLYGCNFIVRRKVLERETFDERLPLYGWLEDEDFSGRIRALGSLIVASDAVCVHLGFKSGGRTSHKRFGYSQVVNPVYLRQKQSITRMRCARLLTRAIAVNAVLAIMPRGARSRRERLLGNLLGARDSLRRQADPERMLNL